MKLKITGLLEFQRQLDKLESEAPNIAKMCLYDGAGVVADKLREGVASIPTEPSHAVPNARNGRQLVSMTPGEKAACLSGLGITKFKGDDNLFETSVGFSGYQDVETEDGEKSVPVPMLMRAVENGTSVRMKHPVCRKAFRAAEGSAVSAMQARLDQEINKIMN